MDGKTLATHFAEILDSARETLRVRGAEYGCADTMFSRWAGIVNLLLSEEDKTLLKEKAEISEKVLAKIMIALKLAREANSHKKDNLVDLCGYVQLYYNLNLRD